MKNKKAQREYQRKWKAARRASWFEGKCCVKCGSTDRLEIDHIDPKTKVSNQIWTWSKHRRDEELGKCQILCHACHLKKTAVDLREMDVNARLRIADPIGTAWCYSGKHFVNVDGFTKNKKKRRGLENDCRLCRSRRRSKGIYKTKLQNASAGETVDTIRL